MAAGQIVLIVCVSLASLAQLWRVPKPWAFLILFIVLFPKVPLALVPGDTTALRVDDFVLGLMLGGWALAQILGRQRRIPASPVTPLILLYGLIAVVTSLLGIAATTATPMTAAFHF